MPSNRKPLKAYIRGAYGPGNLGDDVLLEVCLNILTKHFKEKDISVGIKQPQKTGYLKKFKCQYLPISAPIDTDILFFGGGGQFFEFNGVKAQKTFKQKYNSARSQGLTPLEIFKIYVLRALKVKNIKFRKSAALCLGLGPFETTPETKIVEKIQPFLECDFKSVRDQESLEILEKINKTSAIYTDPTFLVNHWYTQPYLPKETATESIGFILRDWTLNDHGSNVLANTVKAARTLLSQGRTVKLISLYYEYDKKTIERNRDFEWIIWNPHSDTPESFVNKLREEFGILVSTRAHGVLLPSHVGLPSVVIGIEPKLKNIHTLLPNGTLYSDGLCSDDIISKTLNGLKEQKELSQKLLADTQKQTAIANNFLKDIDTWIAKSIQALQ